MYRNWPTGRALMVYGLILCGAAWPTLAHAHPGTCSQNTQMYYQQQAQIYYRQWLAHQQHMQQVWSQYHAQNLQPSSTAASATAHHCNKSQTSVPAIALLQNSPTGHHHNLPSLIVQDPNYTATASTGTAQQQCSCQSHHTAVAKNYSRPQPDPTTTVSTSTSPLQQSVMTHCGKQQNLLTRRATLQNPSTPLQTLNTQDPLTQQFQSTQLQYAHQNPATTVSSQTPLQATSTQLQPCQKQQSMLTRRQYPNTALPTSMPQYPLPTQPLQTGMPAMYPIPMEEIFVFWMPTVDPNGRTTYIPGIAMVDLTSLYLAQMNSNCSQMLQQGTQNVSQFFNPILKTSTTNPSTTTTPGS